MPSFILFHHQKEVLILFHKKEISMKMNMRMNMKDDHDDSTKDGALFMLVLR